MDSEAPAPTFSIAPQYVDPESLDFTVLSQKLDLEIDFLSSSLTGTTVLEIQPLTKDLRRIQLNSRQCEISVEKVTVDGRSCVVEWQDLYKRIAIPEFVDWSAEHWACQKEKIDTLLQNSNGPELSVYLPEGFEIREANAQQLDALSNAAEIRPALAATDYLPIHISIPFSVKNFRDGLHFVGLMKDENRYPHVYTKQSSVTSGISRCIFPCFDNPKIKPSWKISVKCPRTLGDALARPSPVLLEQASHGANGLLNGIKSTRTKKATQSDDGRIDADCLDAEARLLEMIVVCSGDLVNDIIDPADSTKKIVSFVLSGNMVWAGHIAFAIGPFEYVDLSVHRADEEDKLGQTAAKVNGYCLPRLSKDVTNVAQHMAKAIDHFCMNYGSFPFQDYTMCFVGDQIQDTVDSASLTLCSDRLLFGEDVLDEWYPVARKLVYALARQYVGVRILPEKPEDTWLTVGIAYFMMEAYMEILCGTNEYQYEINRRIDLLLKLDLQRPSLYSLGSILHLGSFELEFMELKAPLVLHILDRRLAKHGGTTGLQRVISKIFMNANTEDIKTLTTDDFLKVCEKLSHMKLGDFFYQWVHRSGYPQFTITQKFDKKNLRIKMTIKQVHGSSPPNPERKLKKSEFAREFKEDANEIFEAEVVPTFTGPMSIRIFEADGSPYTNILEIDSREKTFELPYKLKQKKRAVRLRKEERENATSDYDDNFTGSFGDVLNSEQEMNEWKLTNWDPETQAKIENEPFEFISIDIDDQWRISDIDHAMEPYMFEHQLRQSSSVVAHVNAVKYLAKCPPSPIISSILLRTLWDHRYFHGVRTMAAEALAAHATAATNWIGKFHLQKAFKGLFCLQTEAPWTPKPNNFEDKQSYLVQMAIGTAMSKIRDEEGNCPLDCQQFIYDQLRLNENGENKHSDSYYVANLLKALADSIIPQKPADDTVAFAVAAEMNDEEKEDLQIFQHKALKILDEHLNTDLTMPSWNNIYTRTVLEAKKRLMQANIISLDGQPFMGVLSVDSHELVQIEAIAAIVDLGVLFRSDEQIPLFVEYMSEAPSPFIRNQCMKIFWCGLASVAYGEYLEKEPVAADDGLIVYQEGQEQSDARAAQIARSTSISAALAALKNDLRDNQVLKTAFTYAIKSPWIDLSEQMTLLEYCSILYDPLLSCRVKLRLPRYWTGQSLGKGRLVFTKTDKIRTKITTKPAPTPPMPSMPVVQAPAFASAPAPAPVPTPKKTKLTSNGNGEMRAPAKPAAKPPAASRSSTATAATSKRASSVSSNSTTTSHSQSTVGQTPKAKPSTVIKLKLSNKDALSRLSNGPSAKKRKAETDIPSPVPVAPSMRTGSKPTIKLKLGSASSASSPAPAQSPVARTPLPAGNGKERTPLPNGNSKGQQQSPDGRKPLPDGRPQKKRAYQEAEEDSPQSKKKKKALPKEEGEGDKPKGSHVIKLRLGARLKGLALD